MRSETREERMQPLAHALSLFVPFYGYWQVHRHFTLIGQLLARAGSARVDAMSATLGAVLWSMTFLHYSNEPLFTVLNAIELAAAAAVVVYGQRALNAYWRARPTSVAPERILPTDWIALAVAAAFFVWSLTGYFTAPAN
jgi:hypothetical protein